MSYCRWSTPIPELTPDVDLSWKKMMEIYSDGGYELWAKYMEDNNVIMSDAYVYETQIGFVCHWVGEEEEDFWCETPGEMAEYLTEMREKGFRVPESAIQSLIYDEGSSYE
jgi:hypothetical protein